MSKYTTEVRYLCESLSGLTESTGYNGITAAITAAAPQIFSFDFPIWDESYRLALEIKILKHFYLREIGAETYGMWKLWLDETMNRIMPFYNQLYQTTVLDFNPLHDVEYTREYQKTGDRSEQGTNSAESSVESADSGTSGQTRTGSNTASESTETANTAETQKQDQQSRSEDTSQAGSVTSDATQQNTGTVKNTGTDTDTSWDLHSDTPQGSTSNVTLEANGYLTDARKQTDTKTINETRTDALLQQTHGTNESAQSGSLSAESSGNSQESSSSAGSTTTTGTGSHTETTTGTDDRVRAESRQSLEELQKAITSTDAYIEHVVGKQGNGSFMKMIRELRENILNIDQMILNDLEPLFFALW